MRCTAYSHEGWLADVFPTYSSTLMRVFPGRTVLWTRAFPQFERLTKISVAPLDIVFSGVQSTWGLHVSRRQQFSRVHSFRHFIFVSAVVSYFLVHRLAPAKVKIHLKLIQQHFTNYNFCVTISRRQRQEMKERHPSNQHQTCVVRRWFQLRFIHPRTLPFNSIA